MILSMMIIVSIFLILPFLYRWKIDDDHQKLKFEDLQRQNITNE
jgi:hypothetical protein